MKEDQKAKTMYLGQRGKNLLLRLNKDDKNLCIELDDSGIITILEKLIEIRSKSEITMMLHEITSDQDFDSDEDEIIEDIVEGDPI